jgi:hypothetical protein
MISSLVSALSDSDTVWVLCQPGSYVNIRARASGRSENAGYAYCGDGFQTDGRKKGGFVHVFCSNEWGEGWIAAGYLTTERPVPVDRKMTVDASGRVKARKTIGGKRRCWVRPGDEVTVYWMSADWAVTNKGYIRSDCLGD